jgi:hypothetical protein
MGWEQRGSRQYYYKKERHGSRVKSVYIGCGEVAHIVAQIQSSSPLLERYARSMKSSKAEEHEKAQTALDQLTDRIRIITQAALLTAGFHAHKRQWRKRRNGGTDHRECDER